MKAVETRGLTKVYRMGSVEVEALKGVDISVEGGEFISIMGPSGSGKSTLLHLLGGVDKPTSGKIFIDGIDATELTNNHLSDLRREKIGFIFQTFNLLPTLTALENVTVPLLPRGPPREEVEKRAIKLLHEVGLSHRLGHKPHELSGGESQRVAIARSLINKPTLVLGDEPTGELDSKTGEAVMALLRQLNEREKVTLILVTHDAAIAKKTDRTIFLKDGQIVDEKAN